MQLIIDSIDTQSRNKIVIHNEDIPEITSLDVGFHLSNSINSLSANKQYALNVESILEKLLVKSTHHHPQYGTMLSIKNLGILFEPELKINFLSLLDKYSKDICIFVKWEGELDKNTLYFLSKEKGIEINIKNLSHIII